MSKNEKNQKTFRTQYFIDKPFQIKFILSIISVVLFGMLITLGILWYYSQTRYQDGLYHTQEINIVKKEDGKLETEVVSTKSFNRIQLFWQPVVMVSLFYMLLLIVFGLFYSHSMAGPLYRIRKELDRVLQGQHVKQITLRKRDHFKNLAEQLNQLIAKVNKK